MALALSATRAAVLSGASPWTPAKLPGTLACWIAAHRLATVADGATAQTWTDLSGNGNSPTQATAGNRPTKTAGAQGGRSGITFDSDDSMAAADSASLDLLTNFVSCFAVIKTPASLAATPAIMFKGAGASIGAFGFFVSATGKLTLQIRGNAADRTSAATMTALSVSTPYIVGVTWASEVINFYVNGAMVFTVTPGDGNATIKTDGGGLNLGSWTDGTSNLWAGDIYELVLVATPAAIIPADLASLQTYLNQWRVY